MLSHYYLTFIIFFLEEDYVARANYVKIAPKITPMLSGMPHQGMYSLLIKYWL